tara:strand:+ start:379 stop:567 length:189 start_codon:yes stop_codon:yes gene_type:complete
MPAMSCTSSWSPRLLQKISCFTGFYLAPHQVIRYKHTRAIKAVLLAQSHKTKTLTSPDKKEN